MWVGEADTGYVIEGYDADDVEIGRISVYSTGPDSLRMTHEYARPCSADEPSKDCVDVFDVAIGFADPPDEHWHNAHQTLPDNLVMQRMQAMMIKAGELPQPFIGKHLKCALTIAGSVAACLGTSPSIGPGVAVCGAGTLASVCACKAQIEKLFPALDIDKVCDPKL